LYIDVAADAFSPGYFAVTVYASDSPESGQEFPGGPNARVIVDVIHNYQLITPLLSAYLPYVQLRAHAEKVNERFRHPGYGTPPGSIPPTVEPPTPTFTPTETLTPSATPTASPTPTDTPFGAPTATYTPIPIPTNTPTQTPTPTEYPCEVVASNVTTSSGSKTFKFQLQNNYSNNLYISSLTLTWPDGDNGNLNHIYFKYNEIWNGEEETSPTTVSEGWMGGSWRRRLDSGNIRWLEFQFQSDAIDSGYFASVSFYGLGCTVEVSK